MLVQVKLSGPFVEVDLTRLRSLILTAVFCLACVALSFASATDVYITPNGSPTGVCTTSPQAPAWFNNSANWGSGASQIGPGTKVHLCGNFTGTAGGNVLAAKGSGNPGVPVTILFEAGASISSPVCGGNSVGCLSVYGLSNIVVDGGNACGATAGGGSSNSSCNGVIQNTANGTSLAYKQPSYAIEAGGCRNCEFRNLGIYNAYVHTSVTDNSIDQQQMTAIHANGGDTISIHDNLIHDAGWAITGPVTSRLSVSNNYLYNIEHGVGYGTGTASVSSYGNIFIHDNHFGSMANWDYSNGGAHHDSIHIWGDQGGSLVGGPIYIYNNQFDGDPGQYVNAYIYLEQGVSNAKIFNNVMISPSTRSFPTQICQCNKGTSAAANNASYNNTVLGGSLSTGGSTNLLVAGTNQSWINNALNGQNTILFFQSGTIASGGVLTNAYENTMSDGGDPNTLTYLGGNNTDALSVFQSQLPVGSGQDQGSMLVAASGMKLDAQGHLLSGSPLVQAGTNLTTLCNSDPNLAPLCRDKSGNPRPASGPWDIGAFNSGSTTTSSGPASPSGLVATVQ